MNYDFLVIDNLVSLDSAPFNKIVVKVTIESIPVIIKIMKKKCPRPTNFKVL